MLVTVATSYDPTEALILRALLESAEIPASVADLNLVTANWPWAVALGGVRVQVPQSQALLAKGLLADYYAGRLEEDAVRASESEPGPAAACEHDGRTVRVPLQQKLFALLLFVFSGVTYPTRSHRICVKCQQALDPDATAA
jgi:hypothetical protein